MKKRFSFPEQNAEQDWGDIGLKIWLSLPRDDKFSLKKQPKYIIFEFCVTKNNTMNK